MLMRRTSPVRTASGDGGSGGSLRHRSCGLGRRHIPYRYLHNSAEVVAVSYRFPYPPRNRDLPASNRAKVGPGSTQELMVAPMPAAVSQKLV